MAILELQNVKLSFGGLTAVNDVSFKVHEKEIFAVIGPNGAGKTSLFNTITGIYQPSSGQILFGGVPLKRQFTARTALGIGLIGILSFWGALISLNINTLWESAISLNYVYQESFPWQKALSDFNEVVISVLSSWSVIFPLLFAAMGMVGAWITWKRSVSSPEVVAISGISRTFQNIRLFEQLSVIENVLIGMDRRFITNIVHAIFRIPPFFKERKFGERRAREILEFVELDQFAGQLADSLPYGYQRRLEIARALAADPKIILLDEPAAGMNPAEAEELKGLIEKIRHAGITVLLIEHHMKVVMGLSDRIAVLDYGNLIALGTPEEISKDNKVISAYLGTEEHH